MNDQIASLEQKNHFDGLLALRACACLMVLVWHCGVPRGSIIYHGIDLTWLLLPNGLNAVWVFFCLSGYSMGKAFYSGRYRLNRSGVMNFWRNRCLRLVPLYYFFLAITTIFVYPNVLKPENWGILLRNLTFTYAVDLVPLPFKTSGVIWSLSTEAQFYLLTPFLFSFFYYAVRSRRQIFIAMSLVIVFAFVVKLTVWVAFFEVMRTNLNAALAYWYTPLINNLDLFLVGFLLNPLLRLRRNSGDRAAVPAWHARAWKIGAVLLLVGLLLFSSSHIYHAEQWGSLTRRSGGVLTSATVFLFQPLTAIAVSLYIYAFERNPDPQSDQLVAPSAIPLSFEAILQNPMRGLEVLGNLSYGIYLWHAPILDSISPILTASQPLEGFFLRIKVAVILSLLFAALTYYLVEKPASRLKFYRTQKEGESGAIDPEKAEQNL
jgi:peptidoglycan/LPS O-acetylase OafA/YrhL